MRGLNLTNELWRPMVEHVQVIEDPGLDGRFNGYTIPRPEHATLVLYFGSKGNVSIGDLLWQAGQILMKKCSAGICSNQPALVLGHKALLELIPTLSQELVSKHDLTGLLAEIAQICPNCYGDRDGQRVIKFLCDAGSLLPQSENDASREELRCVLEDVDVVVLLTILHDRLGGRDPGANERELAKRSVNDALGALWNRYAKIAGDERARKALELARSAQSDSNNPGSPTPPASAPAAGTPDSTL